ncbi:hypothetical protein NDU88_004417 [Pleurodeles waltl]|uniref:Uncharacterized protein n=1 Tax=Pleurodeles waltl TaxID=8319 RepID=A0AAV7QEV0_PLEWA|nr:hypothetical protein NDU88_004417 [Pleurodeles waltl]
MSRLTPSPALPPFQRLGPVIDCARREVRFQGLPPGPDVRKLTGGSKPADKVNKAGLPWQLAFVKTRTRRERKTCQEQFLFTDLKRH